jgi:hypothetical protein
VMKGMSRSLERAELFHTPGVAAEKTAG